MSKPNQVEKETYDQIEYNELIIKFHGDTEKAKKEFENLKEKRESELDIVSKLLEWTYDFSLESVNGQMRLNMFTLIKDIQEKAVNKYFEIYRKMYKSMYSIEIGEYATNLNFTEEAKEVNKVEEFYKEKQKEEVSKIKNIFSYITIGLGAAISVAAFFVHLSLLVVGCAFVIGGVCNILFKKRKVKNIIRLNQDKKRITLEILHKLINEFNVFQENYRQFDSISKKIIDEFVW